LPLSAALPSALQASDAGDGILRVRPRAHGNIALNRLRSALAGHEFEIVLSRGVGKPSAIKARAFEEWQSFEHALIGGQLFPLIEARAVDARWFQSFDQLARASVSGRLHELAAINRDDGFEFVRSFAPDLIVSIRFGQIFRPPLIALPRLGIINLHSGILPDYRGILATFWAMLHGETEIGCTLHYVTDAGIDTGHPRLGGTAPLWISELPHTRRRQP
jgi:methionyl-tRNA formyltransferase